MFVRRFPNAFTESPWKKVYVFSMILFFLMLSDATLSFWVPGFFQEALGSSFLMGIIVSFSSVVGIMVDLVFPQILKKLRLKKLILGGIIFSIFFSIILYSSTIYPFILIFLLSMVVWGIYYEFIIFSSHEFMAVSVPRVLHSSAWAIYGVFKNLAYFLGPLIGSVLVSKGNKYVLLMSLFFTLVSLSFLGFLKKGSTSKQVGRPNLHPYLEVKHWGSLFKRIWTIVVLALCLGFIDATFWTSGAVWTQKLAEKSFLGNFFLPMYTMPSLLVGFWVAKFKWHEGKKKKAEIFLFVSGVFLVLLRLSSSVYWQLLIVFISSFMLAMVYPLIEGVYSDIVARMGKEKGHMIGLLSSIQSAAYIIAPIISGYMSSKIGEQSTFSFVGGVTVLVSIVLLLVTPKKLQLPQTEIKNWE